MIKLLLVEDDSTFSYIVKNELQEIIGGYEVITATNGAEGLKAWKEYHPDIIIKWWNVSAKWMGIFLSCSPLH